MSGALVALRRPRGWHREVLLFVGAYVAYSLLRGGMGSDSVSAGLENARAVVELQATLGINVEAAVQEHLIGQEPLMWLLNRLYLIAQFAVVPAALVWVYRRRRPLYPVLRTTVLATWIIALPVYALFPTAPPRLAGIGIVDTISEQTRFALDSPLATAFYNPVAAVPSLHAGFAFAVGIALAASLRSLWTRAAALLWGPAVALVVVATGNHFVIDIVLGAVAVLLGYLVALAIHREPKAARRARARAEAGAAGAPLRVALLCPYDWAHPGGVRSHVRGLADALRARGHSVDVLAAGRGGAEPGVRLLGATTPVAINGSVARIAITPAATWRVWRTLAAGRYDVVHLHEPIVPMVCWTALWIRRSALQATFHAYRPGDRPYGIARPLFGRLVRRVPTAIAVSEAARSCAEAITTRPITVIPNGVAPPPPAPVGARDRSGPPRILFIGRNEPRKGLAVLMDALDELPADVRLDVVGATADEIEPLLAGRADPGRIDAHGLVSDDERARLLARADVLCAPSLSGESFGLVLAEAMALGVPVVASDICGYRDVLRPGAGLLVPAADRARLAAALTTVIADRGMRERLRNDAGRAVAALRWDRVSERVEREYRRALIERAERMAPEAADAPEGAPAS